MFEYELVSQSVGAREKIAAWHREYNQERPHSSLAYQTPEEFARGCQGTP